MYFLYADSKLEVYRECKIEKCQPYLYIDLHNELLISLEKKKNFTAL